MITRSAALILTLAAALPAQTLEYSDLPLDHPAAAAVRTCVAHGVLDGYDGKFHGQKLINRYQISVISKRIMEADQLSTEHAFHPVPDMPRTHWAYKSAQKALTHGYIHLGLVRDDLSRPPTDGKFHGEYLVNRYQLAYLIAAHMKRVRPGLVQGAYGQLPSDVAPDGFYADAIRTVVDSGLMETREGAFQGEELVNRFSLAMVLGRLLPEVGYQEEEPVEEVSGLEVDHQQGFFGRIWSQATEGRVQEQEMAKLIEVVSEQRLEIEFLNNRLQELELQLELLEAGR